MSRSAWPLAAFVLAVCFGAALGTENTEATVALAVALAMLFLFGGFARSAPGRQQTARVDPVVPPATSTPARIEADSRLRRALWGGGLLLLLIVAVDNQGDFVEGSGRRYLLLLIPALAVASAAVVCKGARLAPLTVADRFLATLGICGLLGSVYGSLFLGTPNPGIIIFLPMLLLGLMHLVVREPVTPKEADRYQRALLWVGIAFLVFGVLGRSSISPLGASTLNVHERAYFVAMGVVACVLLQRRVLTVLMVALTVVMFLQYPAATWIIAAACLVATTFATSRRGRRSGVLVLIALAIVVAGFGFTQVQSGNSSFAKDYFAFLDKTDNSETRRQLWKAAEVRINDSPLVGSVFTGNFTVENVGRVISNLQEGDRIEPHNDYLQILLLGGVFGLLLFIGFIVSANVVVIRRVRRLADAGAASQCTLARVLLVGFNTALCVAVFNPVINTLGGASSLFLIYSLMMTVREPKVVAVGGSVNLEAGRTL